jgi:ATP-dependent Clp protease protease subunit
MPALDGSVAAHVKTSTSSTDSFMKRSAHFAALLLLAGAFQGCSILIQPDPAENTAKTAAPINFSDPVLNERRILLFGDITERVAQETIQKLFYLDAQTEAPIDLYLMTPGGDLKAAFAIENAMQILHSRVNTYAFAECNSGGAMLLAAGTGQRAAFRGAMIVIHGIQVHGKPPPDYFEGIQAYYTEFWRRRARLPAAWVPIPPNRTYVLTAEQAKAYGVVDKIIDRQETPPGVGGS